MAEQRNMEWWRVRWEEWSLSLIKMVALTEFNNEGMEYALDLLPEDMAPRYRQHWQKALSLYPDTPFTLDTFRDVEGQLEVFRASAAILPEYPPDESIALRLKTDIRDAARRVSGAQRMLAAQAEYLMSKDVDAVEQQVVADITLSSGGMRPALTAAELVRDIEAEDKTYAENPLADGEVRGMASAYRQLDYLLGGWYTSELALVAGRPSMGKSVILMALIAGLAATGQPAVLYNYEMVSSGYLRRIASWRARVKARDVIRGTIFQKAYSDEAAAARYNRALRWVESLPITIVPASGMTMAELFADAVKRKKRDGAAIIGIDTLNLVRGARSEEFRVTMTNHAHESARLAKQHDLLVVAAVQLSRALKARADKRPQLDDMREAGALEEDADVVIAPYREWYYSRLPDDKRKAEVHILKNRNRGVTRAKIPMTWEDDYVGFYEAPDVNQLAYQEPRNTSAKPDKEDPYQGEFPWWIEK